MATNKYIHQLSGITNPSLTGFTAFDNETATYKVSLGTLRQTLVDSGSHYFTGSQNINGSLIVSGSITAQQYIVSSSLINVTNYNVSGSSVFGNTLDDLHQFTGSVNITGSLIINGTSFTASTSGTSGTSGVNGTSGTSGISGSNGSSGTSGTSGSNGSSGDNGSSGTSGTSGESGTSGTSGTSGESGTSGTSGESGSSGTSGTSGESGTSGTSGTSGESGSSGTSGESGTSGTSGTSGISPSLSPYNGNVTINGDLSITGNTIIGSVTENVLVDGGFTGNRDFDYSSGSIFYLTGLTGNGTWNVNNIPTENNKAVTITYVISQGITPYSSSQYQINSSNVTVKWVDNVIPTGSANNVEVIGLTAFRIGSSWDVLGSLSTFGL